jgi:hypothetical protein
LNVNIQDSAAVNAETIVGLGSGFYTNFTRGGKIFELTNHLGNVLATVSDKRWWQSGNAVADLVSAQEYYPFGMLMPGRGFSSGGYRYGFNGQEKSNEVNGDGNSYTAEFWQYDSRIGRRWNLDPESVTGISEYATLNNSPIFYSDLLGNVSEPPGWYTKGRSLYTKFMYWSRGDDPDESGIDYDRVVNNIASVEWKSWSQVKSDTRETAGNLYWSFWGDVNGLVKAASLGGYSRSAEDFNLTETQAGYFNGGTAVFQHAGMIDGINGGASSSPSFAASSTTVTLAKVTSAELKVNTIVLSNAVQNKKDGIRREEEELASLQEQYPDAQIWRERYLRDANGKIVRDPLSNTGRRIDYAVFQSGDVQRLVEVTSITADKAGQTAKEETIRALGGTYIKAPGRKGLLYSVQDVITELSRRQ